MNLLINIGIIDNNLIVNYFYKKLLAFFTLVILLNKDKEIIEFFNRKIKNNKEAIK